MKDLVGGKKREITGVLGRPRFKENMLLTVDDTPLMRMGSISVVVVFSSFLLFFSGGPGGLSPPEARFPPPVPDIMTSATKESQLK